VWLIGVVLASIAVDPLDPVPSAAGVLTLLLALLHGLTRWRSPWTLLLQAVLLPWAGDLGPGLLAASVLLVVRGRVRWALFAAVLVAAGALNPDNAFACSVAVVNALSQGLILFGMTRLGDVRAEVHAARHELAAWSVAGERTRAARDLDRALGGALASIIDLAAQGRADEIAERAREAADRARQPISGAEPPHGDLTPRLALPILVAAHAGFLVTSAIYLEGRPAPLLVVTAVMGLQLYHSLPRPPGVRPRHFLWTAPLLTLLACGPVLHPGQAYPQLVGFAVGTYLMAGRAFWPPAGLCAGLLPLVLQARGHPPAENLYWTFNAVAIAVIFYGLATQTRLVFEAREARLALAGIAVARERRRISRDVHDLLGYGTSAMAVKAELAARLPERRAEELAEIAGIARRALGELRAIGRDDDPGLSFDDELESAVSLLEAAGVAVTVSVSETAPRDDPLLAIVLRESVTNVLRHATATACRMVLTGTGLRIHNDGAAGAAPGRPGQGTDNLRERVEAAGGVLNVHAEGDDYRVEVLYPLVVDGDADGVEAVAGV